MRTYIVGVRNATKIIPLLVLWGCSVLALTHHCLRGVLSSIEGWRVNYIHTIFVLLPGVLLFRETWVACLSCATL